jgi:hypothetical protein
MTVSLQGGGQAEDLSSGSNCTRDETSTSFTTQGDNERHGFQITAKGGGSCSIEPSWSYFKVSVKDSSGKEVGHGESLWLGQTGAGRSYFVACDQAHQGDQPKPWVGLKCSENGDFEVKISRP